jgi:GTP cyclohydrolase I
MGSGSPPPTGPKPKSVIPSHLLNGGSPLNNTSVASRDARERESVQTSIRSSFAPRIPAEFDLPESDAPAADHASSYDSPRRRSSVVTKYAVFELCFLMCLTNAARLQAHAE